VNAICLERMRNQRSNSHQGHTMNEGNATASISELRSPIKSASTLTPK